MIMDRVEKVKCGKKFSNKIFLLQGISYKKDISFTEEIEEAKDLGVIKEYIPSLSREKNGFHSGRVDTLFTDGTIEKILGSYLDKKKHVIYLCGHPEMVDFLRNFLYSKDFEDKLDIKFEKYWNELKLV